MLLFDEETGEGKKVPKGGYTPAFWKKIVEGLKQSIFLPTNFDLNYRTFLESLKDADKKKSAVLSAILDRNLLPNSIMGKRIADVYADAAN